MYTLHNAPPSADGSWAGPSQQTLGINQCCFNVGPPSSTLAQHWNNIGLIPSNCWVAPASWDPFLRRAAGVALVPVAYSSALCQLQNLLALVTRAMRLSVTPPPPTPKLMGVFRGVKRAQRFSFHSRQSPIILDDPKTAKLLRDDH